MRLRQPEPPENVRFERSDGTVIPVECVHVGRINGVDEWRIVTDVAIDRSAGLWFICADHLPARCAINFRVAC